MKKYIYIFLIFFSTTFKGFGGDMQPLHKTGELNAYASSNIEYNEAEKGNRNYKSAKEIIHNIVSVVGLKPNFEIRSAEIQNAAAVYYSGKRYILYDPAFMAKIENATKTDWAAISILAHEIGHHLNGHTTMSEGGNPHLELEADEFSGFVLRKMGASLEDAQKAMRLISDERGSATHPARSYRLSAIAQGYKRANDQLLAVVNQAQPAPQDEIEIETETEDYNEDYNTVAKADLEFDKRHIFTEVHFNKLPERKFFITKKLNLIEVTDNGVEVLGDIVKSRNNTLELNIYEDEYEIKLNISPKGLLYNKNNTIVGYLKNPTA